MKKVALTTKFNQISEHWQPKIVGALNGQHVKLAKLKGEFVWHKHEEEDEMFLVIKGILKIEFRDKVEILSPNEFIIVPKGVEHRPIAEEEVELLLFEPIGTSNTGNNPGEKTVDQPNWI